MTTALHLCTPDDAETLSGLMARFAAEHDLPQTEDARRQAVAPLLEGHPYGMAYLFGPQRAPVGYLIATVSWTLDTGGLEATIDEFYLRDAVRDRGITTEVLIGIGKTFKANGLHKLHVIVPKGDSTEAYNKAGFSNSKTATTLTRAL